MIFGTAYMGSHTPDTLKRELEDIRRAGFDQVIISCQENDYIHFPGKIQYAPKIAHDLGLKILVNLWGYANAFGGGRISRLVADEPEVRVVGPDGSPRPLDQADGTKLQPGCPNHPRVVSRALEFVMQSIDAGVDGFFWDEPTKFDCYCSACKRIYMERAGEEITATSPEKLAEFRRHSVYRWIDAMSRLVKERDRKLITSTCVMPSDRDSWEDVPKCEWLDSLGTDTYWMMERKPIEWMREPCAKLVDIARKGGKSPHLWLQCWKIEGGREREIIDAARELEAAQPDAIYVWAYKGQMGTSETCVDAEQAWNCALEGLRAVGMKSR